MNRTIPTVGATLVAAAGFALIPATAASAHTPDVKADCHGLTVQLTNYENATVKVWLNGDVADTKTGMRNYSKTFPTDGDGFTYRVKVDDNGTRYDKDTGVVVVKGCPVPTSTVTVTQPPVTTTVTLPPTTSTETVPGPTSTVTTTGPAVTTTVTGEPTTVMETLPGQTSTTALIGAAKLVTVTKPGKTSTTVRTGKDQLAFTGMDFGLAGLGVALFGGGVFLHGARRRVGSHR